MIDYIIRNYKEIGGIIAAAWVGLRYAIKGYRVCNKNIKAFKLWVSNVSKSLQLITELAEKVNIMASKQEIITDNISAALFECNPIGEVISVNKAWQELTGLEENLAIGDSWKQMIHEDDLQKVEKRGAEFSKAGTNYDGYFRIRNYKTGEVISVHATSEKLFNKVTGECYSIIGTLKKV
jgi:PAS domain S-box-containing protein